jgi:hypothetical protein
MVKLINIRNRKRITFSCQLFFAYFCITDYFAGEKVAYMRFEANQYLCLMLGMEISAVPCASRVHISKELPTSYSNSCFHISSKELPISLSRGDSLSIRSMSSEIIFLSEEGEQEDT